MVSEKRRYQVLTTDDAKAVADAELGVWDILGQVEYGLPEVDDRYHIWRVPLVRPGSTEKVGEVVIDARSALVQARRSSDPAVVKARLAGRANGAAEPAEPPAEAIPRPALANTILLGDSELTLAGLPAGAIDLVFTSPPYFNARPDYMDYLGYEEYLQKIRRIIQQAHRLLGEGRFFVMNVAPVLLRRANRSQASRRIAVPFDMHRLFVDEGFDFIDDIIWTKPEGAGWATGRGRRFAADRNPLQYKAVPVTEYVLVYRKHTDRLIDWNIRSHPNQDAVRRSRVQDGYERTNVWQIAPASSRAAPGRLPGRAGGADHPLLLVRGRHRARSVRRHRHGRRRGGQAEAALRARRAGPRVRRGDAAGRRAVARARGRRGGLPELPRDRRARRAVSALGDVAGSC